MAVTLYTTPTCSWCRAAKQYLQQRAIPFREVDVARNPAAAAEVVRKSGQMGVPVLDINGRIIVGFDRPAIARALGIRE